MEYALRIEACCGARVLLLFAACILGSPPAIAAGWQQSISVPMTLESESNPTLAPTGGTRLGRTRVVPDYKLSGTFGVDQIGAGLALQIERASDRTISQPRQDPSLFLDWKRETLHGEFGLSTRYQEASTSTSELYETGLIVRDGTRKTQSLSGNWRSAFSERSSLAANADRTSVAYDGGTLTNYTNTNLGLTYNYAWNERCEPFLRLETSHYSPDGAVSSPSSSGTLTGGVQFKISEILELTAQAGRRKVSGADSGTWQGNFALRHTGRSQTAIFEISRTNSASGAGGFVESDSVKGGWSYSIDARTNSGVDVSRTNTKGLTANTMNQLGAWINQELSPHWIGRLNYQYRQRQQIGSPDTSSSLLGLSLIYSHPDF
jgi:hypothetical protein